MGDTYGRNGGHGLMCRVIKNLSFGIICLAIAIVTANITLFYLSYKVNNLEKLNDHIGKDCANHADHQSAS
jgi:hypothetical protein